ncbi:MAG: hypothetical protein WC054_00825 [Candidatus Nanopelagicales bacterium]
MSLPNSETDRLDPEGKLIELVSGSKVEIQRLKLRQLFRLLRIITRGGAAYIPMLREAMSISGDEERAEAFGTQLLAIALIALPEAEDEAVEFIMSVVEPDGLTPGADKKQRETNDDLRRKLSEELFNPEPEDAISIIEAVIMREKNDLAALGKRLSAAFTMMTKTGQLTNSQTSNSQPESGSPTPELSVVTPEPQTSSRRSTAGKTKKSSTSESAD